jgi:hypothetical protein
MSSKNPLTYVAAGVAAVALAFGAYAIGSSNSSNSGTADASQAGSASRNGQALANGRPPAGFGTKATGAAAAKVKAAVLARFKGTIEQIVKLPDGSYVAHVITSSGEYHVLVSKDFEVTGAQQGGPGAGGRGTPPGLGKPATGAAAAKTKAAALAKYPGTVERVMQLSDGSYVVHVLRSSGGEVHVKVSKGFVVTGTESGTPGGGAAGPPAGATQQ